MAFKLSTGLRTKMLDTDSFATLMLNGFIKLYSGTPPATADAAVTGTLLCIVSDNSSGGGLRLGAAASGAIPKDPTQVWSGINLASGTATYWRYTENADDGTASTSQMRVQGTCATSGADLNMTSVNLSAGATQNIDAGSFALPTF